MEIWHNPRCSKSRQALELLTADGAEPTVRRYLDEPPTAQELSDVLEALGMAPWELVRRGESVFKDLGMAEWDHEPTRWIEAMVAHPILIERPVVIGDDGRAVVARPTQRIHELG